MFVYTAGLSYHHKVWLEEKGGSNKGEIDRLIYINTIIRLTVRITKSFLHIVFFDGRFVKKINYYLDQFLCLCRYDGIVWILGTINHWFFYTRPACYELSYSKPSYEKLHYFFSSLEIQFWKKIPGNLLSVRLLFTIGQVL